MHYIIAGCGRVGSLLAQTLSNEGHDVVVIDKDSASFRRLGASFNGLSLEGVAFDEDLLLTAGIEHADGFVAVTNRDNTNLMAAEVATQLFDVPRVVSRLYYVEKEFTFFKLGINYVCSTTLVSEKLRERLLQSDDLAVQLEKPEIGLQVAEIVLPPGTPDLDVGDLNPGVSLSVVAVTRDNAPLQFDQETCLVEGDRIAIAVRKEGWRLVSERLGGVPGLGTRVEAASQGKAPGPAPFDGNRIKVVIGGCSAVGAHIGYLMWMEGHDVTIIDSEPSKFKRLPSKFAGKTLEGTVYDEEALIEAGIEEADAFAALTKYDNSNLMASEVARNIFKVPHVTARLFNPDKEGTYQALGINFVCGTRLMATVLHERLLTSLVHRVAGCFNNVYGLVEFELPAPWVGKTVGHATDRSGISFAYITRRSTGHVPARNFVLASGDVVTALATQDRIARLENFLQRNRKG
jgi:Trk K+ transport system NAD-binding subunit